MTAAAPQTSTARAALAVVASACCFGSIPVLVTLATGTGAALTTVLAFRYGLAAVILAALILLSRGPTGDPRRSVWIVLVGAVGQTAVAYLGLTALRYIPIANATFLFFTFPAWVAIIAAIRRTEPVTRTRVIALSISLLGIAVMIVGSTRIEGSATGVMFALGAAIAYAIYIPTIERLQRGFDSRATALFVCIGASAAFVVLATLQGTFTTQLHRTAWMAVATLAIVSTVIAFQLFLGGLRILGPVRTAIVSTVEPFFATLLSALILSQPLTGATIAGGALIITAVVLLQRRPNA